MITIFISNTNCPSFQDPTAGCAGKLIYNAETGHVQLQGSNGQILFDSEKEAFTKLNSLSVRLAALLEDAHPGLFTWCEQVRAVTKEIAYLGQLA